MRKLNLFIQLRIKEGELTVKVLFTFYPLYVNYNHGIALLSALCKKRGIQTALYILDTPERFLDYLKQHDFDYIAFSCVTEHDYYKCLPFMIEARIISMQRLTPILLGGVYVRRGTHIIAPVDYICRGEGETLPDFLLDGNDMLFQAKMIAHDLNALPLPDYELFKDIPFNRDIPWLKDEKILPYYSSRGCPHKCSFCEIKGQTGLLRFRYKVKEDLTYLAEQYKPDMFFIGDELLPYYNLRWQASWGDFYHPFVAYIRADISTGQLMWLHEHGLVGCAFGVESGDEEYRNLVLKKRLHDKDIYRTVELLSKLGIKYAPYFMTGMPGETFELTAKTYKMKEKIGGYPYIFNYEPITVR